MWRGGWRGGGGGCGKGGGCRRGGVGGGEGRGGVGGGGGGGGLLYGRNAAIRSSCSIRPGGSRCLSGYGL